MSLDATNLLTLLDSIAKGVEHFESGVGILGTELSTVSKGAANNVATLQAINDASVMAELLPVFRSRATTTKADGLYRTLGGAVIQQALDAHLGSVNAFLTTQNKRVHPNLRKIGMQIDAKNAFAIAAVDPVASFVLTGSGTGTFTGGSDIDTTLYGPANMRVKTTTLIGGVAIVATLTMKKFDQSTEAKEVTIPNGTAANTEIAIGVVGTDLYVGCTAISITGGAVAEAFKVISVVERTVTL